MGRFSRNIVIYQHITIMSVNTVVIKNKRVPHAILISRSNSKAGTGHGLSSHERDKFERARGQLMKSRATNRSRRASDPAQHPWLLAIPSSLLAFWRLAKNRHKEMLIS